MPGTPTQAEAYHVLLIAVMRLCLASRAGIDVDAVANLPALGPHNFIALAELPDGTIRIVINGEVRWMIIGTPWEP